MTIRLDGADVLEAWMERALEALSPGERRQVFRTIGRALLARNRKRMTAETGPDGQAWTPRARDRHGRIRKAAKMMAGLRAARRLKSDPSVEGAEVGWGGRDARLAAVHHYGALDYVDKTRTNKVRYPARPLIGLSEDDTAFVRDALLTHLSERLQR